MTQRKKKQQNPDPYTVADIFREMEVELIASAKQTLSKHEAWEEELGFRWEQWQLAKLRAINAFRVANRKIVKSFIEEAKVVGREVLETTYETAYETSVKLADEVVAEIEVPEIDSSVSLGEVEIPEQDFFHINDDKVKVVIEEMESTFTNTEGLVMRKMDDTYRRVVDKAVLKLSTGSQTVNQAVDESVKEFLEKGIDAITYSNGNRVNIASYAEMYIRTANQRATFLAQGKVRDERGIYTVLMSQHTNSSPMCEPYQGTVMIDDVFTTLSHDDAVHMARETGYTRLETAMSNHAFHPNCRHSLSTFYPGRTTIPKPFTAEESAQAVERYKLEQKQRRLEANVRKWKRMAEGYTDEKSIKRANERVKHYQAQLREHVKDNPGLRRNYWRERKIG